MKRQFMFSNGGAVSHRVRMPEYATVMFSVWTDSDGGLVDAETVLESGKTRQPTKKQIELLGKRAAFIHSIAVAANK